MKINDMPIEVQVIAAKTLSAKILNPETSAIVKGEPVQELAREVKEAFIELYSELDSARQQSDQEEA